MSEEIPRNFIGSKENPAKNIRDLDTAMIGRKNVIIYTKGNFELNEKIIFNIHIRNIELKAIENDS